MASANSNNDNFLRMVRQQSTNPVAGGNSENYQPVPMRNNNSEETKTIWCTPLNIFFFISTIVILVLLTILIAVYK
jgi:hypothetical protein